MKTASFIGSTAALLAAQLTAPISPLAPTAHAQSDWTAPSFSFWDGSGNWTPNGAPTASTDVMFDQTGSYSVFLTGSLDRITLVGNTTSLAQDVTFANGQPTITGGGGAFLDSTGTGRIDDPSAAMLSQGPDVTLNGAAWMNDGGVYVGDLGGGTLNLTNDALLISGGVRVANQAGSVGHLFMDGSRLGNHLAGTPEFLWVGNGGDGTMMMQNGAEAYITGASIGVAADAIGEVTLTGAGTRFAMGSSNNILQVGESGTGTLNVLDGASIVKSGAASDSRDLRIGNTGAGTGHVLVDNASIAMADDVWMGESLGSSLTIRNAGTITTGDDTIIAQLTIQGAGSSFSGNTSNAGGVAYVGFTGDDATATIEAGGVMTGFKQLNIGQQEPSTGNRMIITGAGSSFDHAAAANADIRVGNAGQGQMDVLNGGSVITDFMRVGELATGDGTLNIVGTDSIVDVRGVGSTGDTVIGTQGQGVLNVTDGGQLTTNTLWFGRTNDATATAIIDNATVNAGADNSGHLFIGGGLGTGGSATVTVRNGGTLTSKHDTYIGQTAGSDGTLIVTGAGTTYQHDDGSVNDILYVGNAGAGRMEVRDGARANVEGLEIGNNSGTAAAELIVDGSSNGTPSTVDINGYLWVGDVRQGNMTISNGAQVNVATSDATDLIRIGDDTTSDGSSLTVTGAGSRLDYFGAGGRISVGYTGGEQNNRVTLEVLDGAVVAAVQRNVDGDIVSQSSLFVGDESNSHGYVKVDGVGSLIEADRMQVGDGPSNSTGVVDITNGGRIAVTSFTEIGANGSGVGTLNISGAGSELTNDSYFALGSDLPTQGTATGTANITDGGRVAHQADGFVGHYSGSTGIATIGSSTGDVSVWDAEASLMVGGTATSAQDAGSGTLNVQTGGVVNVNDILRVWDRGVVNLDGGTINTDFLFLNDSSVAGSATFNFNSGTLNFTTAGSSTLDENQFTRLFGDDKEIVAGQTLSVENAAILAADVNLNGGTFAAGSITQANFDRIDFDAGTFRLTASDLNVGPAGLFGQALTLDHDQSLVVDQNINVQPGATMTVVGGLAAGTISNNGALVFVDTTGAGKTVGGALNSPEGTTITLVGDTTFSGPVSGGGDFFGPGTPDFAGGYAPGDSPSIVTFESDAVFTSVLSMEVGGLLAGSEFDQLQVAGNATVGGALEIDWINGFSLGDGQQVELISAAMLDGTFDSVSGLITPAGLPASLVYTDSSLLLQIGGAIAGDANGDGAVDLLDLDILGQNWQGNGGLAQGDFNGDGSINLLDLDILGQNWGAGTAFSGSFASALSSSAVPEPAALFLMLAGTATVMGGRRRRA